MSRGPCGRGTCLAARKVPWMPAGPAEAIRGSPTAKSACQNIAGLASDTRLPANAAEQPHLPEDALLASASCWAWRIWAPAGDVPARQRRGALRRARRSSGPGVRSSCRPICKRGRQMQWHRRASPTKGQAAVPAAEMPRVDRRIVRPAFPEDPVRAGTGCSGKGRPGKGRPRRQRRRQGTIRQTLRCAL